MIGTVTDKHYGFLIIFGKNGCQGPGNGMVILLAAKQRMTDTDPAVLMLNLINQPVKFVAADHIDRLHDYPPVSLIS
jgi:hypothetical protein